MAHLALTTSYQSASNLGPKRRFVLESSTDCVVSIRVGVDTNDATDGISLTTDDANGNPIPRILTPKNPTFTTDDGAVALKYKVLSGTVTGAVWVDADAAPGTVALTAYTPADAGDYDAAVTTAAAAMDQLAQRVRDEEITTQYQLNIPIFSGLLLATGAPMAVFANGASSVPGVEVTNSKVASVRWNDHATPAAIVVTLPMPQNLDDTANVVFHALVSKIGATVGDATKLTVGVFEQVVGALHDADSDMGGDTDAVVGDATSKTVSEITLALTGANIHASPQTLTFTIKPKSGTLGADDFCLHGAWLEMKKRPLTT